MAFAGGLGIEIDLDEVPTSGAVTGPEKLFAENAGRFLVEVAPDNVEAFLAAIGDVPCGRLGEVTDTGRVVIGGLIDVSAADAKAAWQGTFDW